MTTTNWISLTAELGEEFEKKAPFHDKNGTFVSDNYNLLRTHKYFSAAIPQELGGGGLSHEQMCQIIRVMAMHCPSTALAFSMHQHVVATALWKYKNKGEGAPMLKNVAKNELVLISTGARDWLGSNGELKKIDGGYLFTARKHFASQSAGGDVAVTSGTFLNTDNIWQVLHFAVPMSADGVKVENDWDVMGMRATGSNTITFNEVFIPDSAITIVRPKNEFHVVWDIVLTVALPLIMATYVGIAEKAMEIAISCGSKYDRNKTQMPFMIGRINNLLLSAKTQWRAMYELTNNFDFKPNEATTIAMLSYKTNIAEATKQVVTDAMEAIGGQSFLKIKGLEQLFRDVYASGFHPLPKMEQYAFTGERIIKARG